MKSINILRMRKAGAGSGGSGPVATTKIKIAVTSTQGSGFVAITDVFVYGAINDSSSLITPSGWTATATTTNGANAPSNAIDNNSSTSWQATGSSGDLTIDFGTTLNPAEIGIRTTSAINDSPYGFTISSWNGSSWVVQTTVTAGDMRWGSASLTKYFPFGADFTAAQAHSWRMLETAKQGTGWSTWNELEFRLTAGGADQTSSATAWSNNATGNAQYAFDNTTATSWQAGTGTLGSYLANDLTTRGKVNELVGTNSSVLGDSVSAGKMQYYNGRGSWLDSGAAWSATWAASETKTFNVS